MLGQGGGAPYFCLFLLYLKKKEIKIAVALLEGGNGGIEGLLFKLNLMI